jgi:hypothetical protein
MAEKTTDLSQITDKLYHTMLYHSVNDEWRVFEIFKVEKISVYILNISPY